MANTINWGEIYCSTHWGDSANEVSIDIDSEPACMNA
jgi:hypothetical protein